MPPARQRLQGEREAFARSRAAELERTTPTLLVRLRADSTEAAVKLDDAPVSPSGAPIAVDPGEHVVTVELTGRKWQERLTIAPGEHRELELGAPAVDGTPAEPPAPTRTVSPWTYVAGGVGVAGLIVGTTAGFLALSEKSTIEDHCRDRRCDQEGLDAVSAGQRGAAVSTAGFVVAGVALVATVVLLVTAPSGRAPSKPTAQGAAPPRSSLWAGTFAW
jgi:hypothetical protein